jgi:hypothetical protein
MRSRRPRLTRFVPFRTVEAGLVSSSRETPIRAGWRLTAIVGLTVAVAGGVASIRWCKRSRA